MKLQERKTRLEFVQHYLDTSSEERLRDDRKEILDNKIEISGIIDYLCSKYQLQLSIFTAGMKTLGPEKVKEIINDISKVEKTYYPDNTFGGLGTSIDENYGS